MAFISQKAVKDHVLANFLTAHPVLKTTMLHKDIPDEVVEANMTLIKFGKCSSKAHQEQALHARWSQE